jgi:branched-chain amino acid aminotransferase
LNNRIRVAIAVWPWGRYLGDEGIKRGIRAQVSSTTRMNARSCCPRARSTASMSTRSSPSARPQLSGYDEAILLDDEGYVAEATGENLFLVRRSGRAGDAAAVAADPRAGITRESVITIARELGYVVEEQRFSKEALIEADEIFFTGTAAEVTPVREVDGYVDRQAAAAAL